MQRESDRVHHRACVAFRGATLHQSRRPQAHGARGHEEADRGRMVNRFLSSMGIMLDNFGAKPLKTKEPQPCMVVDALQIEPVSKLKFPANREINREFCRFRPLARFSAPNREANSVACS